MSINRVSNDDTRAHYTNRLLATSAAGAIVGGLYQSNQKNWLYKGTPSDTFVKAVSANLRKDLTSDELKESSKISRFIAKVIDPDVDMESLKPQIKDSKELSEAIKISKEETLDEALERVFSQPKDKARQELLNLQYKTTCDKKAGRTTSLKLLNDNFDASSKRLVKNPNTSERVFKMLKATAHKIQSKSIAIAAGITGLATGALYLVMTDAPGESK